MLFLISLRVIVCLFNFYDVQVQRGFGYTSDELLILARSYMSVSEDPATGTNQKASAFWTRVHIQYNKNVAKVNKNHENDPCWRDLPCDRPKGSLKSQWYTRLQPSIQKFAGIVAKHPPTSGQVKDDTEMDLYYKSMRLLYTNQASEGLPKKFGPYMQAYFFLSNHPKFGAVLEGNDKSGAKKKGCRPKGVSDSSDYRAMSSSQKFPSSSIVNSERPTGRDSAKKSKATDFVIEKVSEGVAMAVASQGTSVTSLKTIEDGLSRANDVMQTMANHQVMAMAPPEIREQYFQEVFDFIQAQARNKRLRLQMENEELALKTKKMQEEMKLYDDDRKMAAVENERKEEETEGMEETENNDGMGEHEKATGNTCNYPDCLFAIGGPPLDVCQGTCGGRRCFHHACNVNWVEREGIDAELRKLCYDCVKIEYV